MITAKPEIVAHVKVPGPQLNGVGRCPFCSVTDPLLEKQWASHAAEWADGKPSNFWAAYKCKSCGCVASVEARQNGDWFQILSIHPVPRSAHEDIPEPARTFLQQGYETLHAPDAAAVMAGSAVDGMLKAKGYEKGSLYDRIDAALANNVLTQGMADWAHSVRLGSNRPRHADKDKPHVSPEEAKQSVEFAEALGSFLFVLTAKIAKGIQAAEKASE